MDQDEAMIDEEIDAEPEEDTGADTEDVDSDDEFEYDEDGNIIIPDVVSDDDADEESADDAEDAADEEDEKDASAGAPTVKDVEASKPAEETADAPSSDSAQKEREELARIKRQLQILESQSKETLSKLGVEGDDILKGLASLAAEVDGVSVEEYMEKRASAERDEQARNLLKAQEYEAIYRTDLAELHAAYPETKQYRHIRELPDDILHEFARCRGMGLSAKKAYAAANPDGIRATVATAVKRQSLHDSKQHLRANVPKGSKDNSGPMPTKSELEFWKNTFPGKTDKELVKLYRETAK